MIRVSFDAFATSFHATEVLLLELERLRLRHDDGAASIGGLVRPVDGWYCFR